MEETHPELKLRDAPQGGWFTLQGKPVGVTPGGNYQAQLMGKWTLHSWLVLENLVGNQILFSLLWVDPSLDFTV